jgi:LysR family transcriptional regulator, transcriptional activator for dmlA
LRDGRLIHVLPAYRTPDADIYAVVPQHLQTTSRVKSFVDFLTLALQTKA